MKNQYRVTKYDPFFWSPVGSYTRDEWTSYADIGRSFSGAILQESEYLKVEESYLFAVEALLHEAKIETLFLHGLENRPANKLPSFVEPGSSLNVSQCIAFARLALREEAWGKLAAPGRAYVHFGWDYYMYFGLPAQCRNAVAAIQARGLFVEACRSPYLRQRPNPSIERTR